MTNLRKTFTTVLRNYGHDIYLQRRITPYINDDNVYEDSLERHTVRHMYPANKGLPSVARENVEGITHDSELIYYFTFDSNPREGDRIYENLEDYPGDLVTWLIDFAVPLRFRSGRIEFWTVGASREVPTA